MNGLGWKPVSEYSKESYMFGSGKKGHAYEIVMIERVL